MLDCSTTYTTDIKMSNENNEKYAEESIKSDSNSCTPSFCRSVGSRRGSNESMHSDISDSEAMTMSDDTPQSAEVLFISPIGIVPKTEEDDSRKTGWLSDEENADFKEFPVHAALSPNRNRKLKAISVTLFDHGCIGRAIQSECIEGGSYKMLDEIEEDIAETPHVINILEEVDFKTQPEKLFGSFGFHEVYTEKTIVDLKDDKQMDTDDVIVREAFSWDEFFISFSGYTWLIFTLFCIVLLSKMDQNGRPFHTKQTFNMSTTSNNTKNTLSSTILLPIKPSTTSIISSSFSLFSHQDTNALWNAMFFHSPNMKPSTDTTLQLPNMKPPPEITLKHSITLPKEVLDRLKPKPKLSFIHYTPSKDGNKIPTTLQNPNNKITTNTYSQRDGNKNPTTINDRNKTPTTLNDRNKTPTVTDITSHSNLSSLKDKNQPSQSPSLKAQHFHTQPAQLLPQKTSNPSPNPNPVTTTDILPQQNLSKRLFPGVKMVKGVMKRFQSTRNRVWLGLKRLGLGLKKLGLGLKKLGLNQSTYSSLIVLMAFYLTIML